MAKSHNKQPNLSSPAGSSSAASDSLRQLADRWSSELTAAGLDEEQIKVDSIEVDASTSGCKVTLTADSKFANLILRNFSPKLHDPTNPGLVGKFGPLTASLSHVDRVVEADSDLSTSADKRVSRISKDEPKLPNR